MRNKISIIGTVVKGLGEGAFFMSMQHYKEELKDRLEFIPYPGTLNIKVDKNQSNLLKKIIPIRIYGYKSGNNIFGGASCYKARIKNIDGSVIVPDLTKHKTSIIEFIATVHLKSKLNIKDGDKVKVELLK